MTLPLEDMLSVGNPNDINSIANVGGPFLFLTPNANPYQLSTSHLGQTNCILTPTTPMANGQPIILKLPDVTGVPATPNKVGFENHSPYQVHIRDFTNLLLLVLQPYQTRQVWGTGTDTDTPLNQTNGKVRMHLTDVSTTAGKWLAEGEGLIQAPVPRTTFIMSRALNIAGGGSENFQITSGTRNYALIDWDESATQRRWFFFYINAFNSNALEVRMVTWDKTLDTLAWGAPKQLLTSSDITGNIDVVKLNQDRAILTVLNGATSIKGWPLLFISEQVIVGSEVDYSSNASTPTRMRMLRMSDTQALVIWDDTLTGTVNNRTIRYVPVSNTNNILVWQTGNYNTYDTSNPTTSDKYSINGAWDAFVVPNGADNNDVYIVGPTTGTKSGNDNWVSVIWLQFQPSTGNVTKNNAARAQANSAFPIYMLSHNSDKLTNPEFYIYAGTTKSPDHRVIKFNRGTSGSIATASMDSFYRWHDANFKINSVPGNISDDGSYNLWFFNSDFFSYGARMDQMRETPPSRNPLQFSTSMNNSVIWPFAGTSQFMAVFIQTGAGYTFQEGNLTSGYVGLQIWETPRL